MRAAILSILLAATAATAAFAGSTVLAPQAAAPKLRVGTYDGRAIAVAYAASRHNPVPQKTAERDVAKKAGDKAKVCELEAWGERLQRQLHRQAFSHVPVDDLLVPVKDGVAALGQAEGLAAIADGYLFTADGVESVDVTDALVKLYEPSARTLETVAEVRKRPVQDLDELEREEDH